MNCIVLLMARFYSISCGGGMLRCRLSLVADAAYHAGVTLCNDRENLSHRCGPGTPPVGSAPARSNFAEAEVKPSYAGVGWLFPWAPLLEPILAPSREKIYAGFSLWFTNNLERFNR
jgi:hypothetical protein